MNMSCPLQTHVLNSGSQDGGVAVRGYEGRLSWRKQITRGDSLVGVTGRDSLMGVLTLALPVFLPVLHE